MSRSICFCFLLVIALTRGQDQETPFPGGPPLIIASLPQCRCSAIEECTKETQKKIESCKVEPTCEKFLQEIGDAAKIRACLDAEHADMLKMEQCVKGKVGELGCTNDEHPKNLTVPVLPFGVVPPPPPAPSTNLTFDEKGEQVEPPTGGPSSPGPPQLAQYLLCVDQCGMAPTEPHRARRSPLNCSMKMKCSLAPPTEEVQEAFRICEEELQVDARQRFITSCECMKAAGVTELDCTPPGYY